MQLVQFDILQFLQVEPYFEVQAVQLDEVAGATCPEGQGVQEELLPVAIVFTWQGYLTFPVQ